MAVVIQENDDADHGLGKGYAITPGRLVDSV